MKLLLLVLMLLIGAPAWAGSPSWRRAPDVSEYLASLEEPPRPPEGWMSEEGVFTRVHALPSDASTAGRLLAHAEDAVPRLAEDLGVPAGRMIDVFVAPDREAFREIQPGHPPDWADGTAWPHRGVIYLHAPRARSGTATALEQVLDHEIVHVLLGRAFGPRAVPRWLQEGMAQLLAREYTAQTTDALAMGLLGDSLIPLADLASGFPADPVRAHLAYAQSADLVAFVRNTWGEDAVRTLVRELSAGKTFDAAIVAATGLPVERVDARWRGRLEGSLLWLRPLVSDEMLFTVASVVFFAGGVLAIRRRRRRLQRWAEEEAAFDHFTDEIEGPTRGEGGGPRAAPPISPRAFLVALPPGVRDQVH